MPQQMSDLMSLVRLREELGADTLTLDARRQLESRVAELEAELEATGIDVEWLLSQRWVVAERRRQAAIAANPTLEGQSAEIAGFLILARIIGLGFLADFLSRTVLVGFLTGVGIQVAAGFQIVRDAHRAQAIDGVFLALHGSMRVEGMAGSPEATLIASWIRSIKTPSWFDWKVSSSTPSSLAAASSMPSMSARVCVP